MRIEYDAICSKYTSVLNENQENARKVREKEKVIVFLEVRKNLI
jgi:hypothetical protein